MKKTAILGSTGSIGTQTLDIIKRNMEDFQVTALTCGSRIDLFEKQNLTDKEIANLTKKNKK